MHGHDRRGIGSPQPMTWRRAIMGVVIATAFIGGWFGPLFFLPNHLTGLWFFGFLLAICFIGWLLPTLAGRMRE